MYDDRPDEPIPPLDRPGVAPLWRVLALGSLLVAALLLPMVIVLFMALVHNGNRQPDNGGGMAPPVVAVGAAAGGVADAADDILDPLNPAYPTRQDLRPAGTFPLPGDPEADPEDPPQSPRKEFRALADRPPAWVSPGPDLPERVLVSFDGANMAYAGDDGLMVGPVGGPIPVDQDVAAGMAAPGNPRWRGGRMVAPAQPARPRPTGGTQTTLSGWSVDGVAVAWVVDNGRPRQHDTRTKITTPHDFKANALLPLPDGRLVVVVREPRAKLDGAAGPAARDLTAVKVMPVPGANGAPTVLVGPVPSRWESPALSPDGKRLAIVSDHGEKPGRRRVFVLSLDGNEPKVEPVSPAADRIDGVCWTPQGKELVYARCLSPVPADHAPGMAKDACDLFLLDLESKKETRLSRGGGFTSPSVTKDGDLYVLMKVQPANGAPAVQLLKMTLKAAGEWAEAQEKIRRDKGKEWKELADTVFKRAGVAADAPDPGSQKKIADAFALAYKKKFDADPPATAETLEWQRREVAGLDLTPDEQDRFRLLLGAVEGEYLLGRQKRSDWHTTKERSGGGPVAAENSFGYAFNPFRPLRAPEKDDSPQSLAEVLFRAEGRRIVLSNDATSAKAALDELVDPDRARGSALLAQGKGDEADRVLRAMASRHAENQYLMIEVGTLLHRHGRDAALAALVKPLLGQLDAGGLSLARDPRLYNLVGVAVLTNDAKKAIVAFQDALRCDLDYGAAYLNLAQAYQKTSRIGDARLCLRRYLKLYPEGEWADDARRRLAAAGDE
jgi:tetratricopeptide (TPR) repeat protein